MNWNKQEKQQRVKDHFWLGFIPSFLLPPLTLIMLFKLKYTTSQPLFEAMWRFGELGRFGSDLFSSVLPSFILFFIFYKLKKERAAQGAFVGAVPMLILSFWMM